MTWKEQLCYRWWVEWGTTEAGGTTPAFGLEDARQVARVLRAEGKNHVRVRKQLRKEITDEP